LFLLKKKSWRIIIWSKHYDILSVLK